MLISYYLLIKTSSSRSRKQNACGASIVIGYSCALVKDCCNVVFIRSQATELRSDPYVSDFAKS